MNRSLIFLLDLTLALVGFLLRVFYRSGGSRLLPGIGRVVGTLQYYLNRARRKRIFEPLQRLFGERIDRKGLNAITRRSFTFYYQKQLDTIFFGEIDRDRIERMVKAEGLENVDGALKGGKGVVLLLAHFGFFLLPLPFLGYRGYKVNQIVGKQVHRSRFEERIWTWRSNQADRLPVQFKQIGRFLRPVYQALANNEIVAIAFDGRDSARWAIVDFFGEKVRFSPGPFDLARRTGAVIIPTFIIQDADNNHRIVFEPPFPLSDDPDQERGSARDVQRFARLFEGYVERYPCHFSMVLNNWSLSGLTHPEAAFFAEK